MSDMETDADGPLSDVTDGSLRRARDHLSKCIERAEKAQDWLEGSDSSPHNATVTDAIQNAQMELMDAENDIRRELDRRDAHEPDQRT